MDCTIHTQQLFAFCLFRARAIYVLYSSYSLLIISPETERVHAGSLSYLPNLANRRRYSVVVIVG